MAIDAHYVLGAPLEEYFVDKDSGLPLAGGTVSFFQDSARITAKTVYELSGTPPNYTFTPLPNPITLSAVGTPQNAGGDNVAIYYYPYDDDPTSSTFGDVQLYYIVVKDSNGVEQFTREAWPANAFSSDSPSDINSTPVQNQIANPQFTRTFLNESATQDSATIRYTNVSGTNTYAFAPDWDFVISGAGTVDVTRIALPGSGIATNPPYSIRVVTSGVSSCKLVQRFNTNSGLWGSSADNDIFLSTIMVVQNNSVAAAGMQMFYSPSSGGSDVTIFDKSCSGSGYKQYSSGSSDAIPASTDSNLGTAGYTDIYIAFPVPCDVNISSVQVVPSFNATSSAIVAYDEASSNRDQALLGDYYIPRLEIRPAASLLTAWDFVLNPAQFGSSQTISTTAAYIWDQTIARSQAGTVAVTRNSVTNGISFAAASGNNSSFYLLQYLSGAQAKEILYTRLSSNINAYKGLGGGDITMRAYLYRSPAAGTIPTLPTSIGSSDATGLFTLSDVNWELIDRSGLDTATAILELGATSDDIQFSGWEITDSGDLADTTLFAMVVTFAWNTATAINVNSISLNKGDIPSRPAPQSQSEVLSECQYYYEKSYDLGVNPGASSLLGALLVQQEPSIIGGTDPTTFGRSFDIQYNTPKRAASTVSFYSTAGGSSGNVWVVYNYQGTGSQQFAKTIAASFWTQTNNGQYASTYISAGSAAIANKGSAGSFDGAISESYIQFHFIADSRLGVV